MAFAHDASGMGPVEIKIENDYKEDNLANQTASSYEFINNAIADAKQTCKRKMIRGGVWWLLGSGVTVGVVFVGLEINTKVKAHDELAIPYAFADYFIAGLAFILFFAAGGVCYSLKDNHRIGWLYPTIRENAEDLGFELTSRSSLNYAKNLFRTLIPDSGTYRNKPEYLQGIRKKIDKKIRTDFLLGFMKRPLYPLCEIKKEEIFDPKTLGLVFEVADSTGTYQFQKDSEAPKRTSVL